MNLPASLGDFLRQQGWGAPRSVQPLGGGCINNAARLETERGPVALAKLNSQAPPGLFACEAAGLRELRGVPGGPRVPGVYGQGEDWLLIEYLEAGRRRPDYWEALGEGLARLHLATAERFGFDHDNYIGLTPQPNRWASDGHEFFGQQRLAYQGDLAVHRNLLSSGERARLERLISRLPELAPPQPASLIHGDLWGGNLMVGPEGEPALIDPAVHYGWAEADLAMTALFGGFDPAVYDAYQTRRSLAPGWRERFEIYNLYHLLNHLNLFGSSYHAGVFSILKRYG